jgi:tetratricopeptide (TPR) repeat protein
MVMFYEMTVMESALPYMNPGGEFSKYDGVLPQAVLKREDIAAETPMTIPGGEVVSTVVLKTALENGKLRGAPFILIDGLNVDHKTIPNAEEIRFAGNPGYFQDDTQHQLEEKLKTLTGNKFDMPIVFYCAGSRCWESYNASLRAIHLGYSNVYWYRGGLTAWKEQETKFTLQELRRVISLVPVESSHVLSNIPVIAALITNRMTGSTAANRGLLDQAKDWNFYYQRGLINVRGAKYDDAITDFIKAIALNPKNADCYHARGGAYANKDDFDDAMADFLKAADLDPAKNAEVHAILLDPKYASAYVNRGHAYRAKKDYDRAIQNYDQAIQLDPKNVAAYWSLGYGYQAKGDYDRAIQNYDQAIQLDPKNVAAYRSLGFAYRAKGDYDRAIQKYDQAIQLDPKNAATYRGRGYAYFSQGNFKVAAAALLSANELENNAYSLIWRYLARERAGENGGEELAVTAARLKSMEWPYPVIELYLGARSPAEVLSVASNADERCEAQFYSGEWHMLRGNHIEALTGLQAAADRCPKTFDEYSGALADLKRLTSSEKPSAPAPSPMSAAPPPKR